jgi:hypothetical protein
MMKVSAVLVAVLGVVMLSRGLVLSGVTIPSSAHRRHRQKMYIRLK